MSNTETKNKKENNMKHIITLMFVSLSAVFFAQNMQIQNMVNYTRGKEYDKAKASADAAMVHETTRNSAKMWMNRGHVYRAISSDTSQKVRSLDLEAEEKSLEAYVTCLKIDAKDNIYKDEVKDPLVQMASRVNRKAGFYRDNKQFDAALKCYDLLETALPYDFDGSLKRNNITKEKLVFNKFETYKASGNMEKTKEFADKLIEAKYKDVKLYTDMMRMTLGAKDTAAALSYIEKGKLLFEDNMTLISTEIDIYLARKKTAELKEKLKKAIEVAPDNEVLHAVLGQINEKSGDMAEAEKAYIKALELKPDYEAVNYKLGALYFNQAADYNKKLNDLPPKETAKAKEYEEKVKENFKKSAPYLEKAYEINPDKAYKQRIFQIYTRLGETEKAAKYKP